MVQLSKAALDDAYKSILINDFSGGLNTNTGPMGLAANESPLMLNWVPFPNRLEFRGGWTVFCTLPGPTDMAWPFYDINGFRRLAVFSNGNLYECATGTAVLKATACYTVGSLVGVQDFNGILYWASQVGPVYLQAYDPVAGTNTAVGGNAPASSYLTILNGSLVAAAPTFPTFPNQPTVYSWANVNAPTVWNAANTQGVGGLGSGQINFLVVANASPFQSLIVGKSGNYLYSYSGALGAQTQSVITCPVGSQAGLSATYVPSGAAETKYGLTIFLGTDGQLWGTDGITATVISEKVLNYLPPIVQNRLATNTAYTFSATFNILDQYYVIDLGGAQQLGFKWDTGAIFPLQGWPSGIYFKSNNSFGSPTMYVASNSIPYCIAQLGLTDTDNGGLPALNYYTPQLHCGAPGQLKEYADISVESYALGTVYSINGSGAPRTDGSIQSMDSVTMTTPSVLGSNIFKLDSSLLNGPNVLGGLSAGLSTNAPLDTHKARIVVKAVSPYDGVSTLTGPLRSNLAQFNIAYQSGPLLGWDVTQMTIRYLNRGYKFVGNQKYSTEGGVPA